MKKLILLLTLLLGLTLVGCQKDDVKQAVSAPTSPATSGGGITPTEPTTTGGGIVAEKTPFVQSDIDYVNGIIKNLKDDGYSIGTTRINNQEIYYDYSRSSDSVKIRTIEKINSIYIFKLVSKDSFGNIKSDWTIYDVTVPRLYEEPESSDKILRDDYLIYEGKVKEKINVADGITIEFPGGADGTEGDGPDYEEFYVAFYKGDIELTSFTIFKLNNEYIAATEKGMIAKATSFETLLNDKIFQDKIQEMINSVK